jgi:hypothetical protein
MATKIAKRGLGSGHNRPRAYRRNAAYSIHPGFLVFFVAKKLNGSPAFSGIAS